MIITAVTTYFLGTEQVEPDDTSLWTPSDPERWTTTAWNLEGTVPETFCVRLQEIRNPDRHVLLHPSTREPGRVQASRLDRDGEATGHTCRDDLAAMLGERTWRSAVPANRYRVVEIMGAVTP